MSWIFFVTEFGLLNETMKSSERVQQPKWLKSIKNRHQVNSWFFHIFIIAHLVVQGVNFNAVGRVEIFKTLVHRAHEKETLSMKFSLVFCCFYVKMASTLAYTPQQHAQYVLWFAECKSDYRQFEEKAHALNENDARVPDLRSLLKWKPFWRKNNKKNPRRFRWRCFFLHALCTRVLKISTLPTALKWTPCISEFSFMISAKK